MKEDNYRVLLNEAKKKTDRTFSLVEASLSRTGRYNPEYNYSSDELEPFDALSDRFMRCVEMFVSFFKTYDSYKSVVKAPTYRDLINVMEKLGLVTNTPLWIKMRDIRNRIVHDYLPDQIKDMYDSIMGEFYEELKYSRSRIENIDELL